eukprot:1336773-Ditylum_brightwellii.AAC.1
MGFATENEVDGIYINCQKGMELYTALIEIDHQKPATPIMTDYKMVEGIVNGTVKQRKTTAMDMRFYWIHD